MFEPFLRVCCSARSILCRAFSERVFLGALSVGRKSRRVCHVRGYVRTCNSVGSISTYRCLGLGPLERADHSLPESGTVNRGPSQYSETVILCTGNSYECNSRALGLRVSRFETRKLAVGAVFKPVCAQKEWSICSSLSSFELEPCIAAAAVEALLIEVDNTQMLNCVCLIMRLLSSGCLE